MESITSPSLEPRLSQHPISAAFPPMSESEFADLVKDIESRGFDDSDPITIFEGKILDGSNRDRACQQLGITPPTTEFVGTYEEAVAFVISRNINRRHLTQGQRAMLAIEVARLGHGGDRRSAAIKGPRGRLNGSAPATTQARTITDAARALKVSPRTVRRAKRVKKHGSPALVAAVKAGTVSVATAAKQVRAAKHVASPKQTPAAPLTELSAPPTSVSPVENMNTTPAASGTLDPDLAAVVQANHELRALAKRVALRPSLGDVGRLLDRSIDIFRTLYPYEGRDAFLAILTEQVAVTTTITSETWPHP